MRFSIRLVILAGLMFHSSACHVLHPNSILSNQVNLPEDLNRNNEPQFEAGRRRPLIDTAGWIIGIPNKIVLWNRTIDNHSISPQTQYVVEQYLTENNLDEVKVRLNQYRPLDDWRRLRRNTSVAWPWRYTFGAVSVLGETIAPGRLFGGDHYNPYTATIHLYSDLPVVGLHEAAHAKDFARRDYPGTYAALYVVPGVPLWHERIATNDVLAYVDFQQDVVLQRQARQVLYPAYGTYVGNAAGAAIPSASTPLFVTGVVTGHLVGRSEARGIATAARHVKPIDRQSPRTITEAPMETIR